MRKKFEFVLFKGYLSNRIRIGYKLKNWVIYRWKHGEIRNSFLDMPGEMIALVCERKRLEEEIKHNEERKE